MDGASWGNLGSSKQLTTAKGKNEGKKREKLKKIERDIDTPGVAAAEGMVDLPMNTQTLRYYVSILSMW